MLLNITQSKQDAERMYTAAAAAAVLAAFLIGKIA